MKLWELTRSRGELIPVTGLVGVAAFIYAVAFSDMNLNWLWLTLGLTIFFNVILVEAYLHRYCTHRSYRINKPLERTLAVLASVVPATGSPAGWAALHVAHHRFSDTEKDPHSSVWSSFWDLLMWRYPYTGNLYMSRRLLSDPFHRQLHRYHVLYLIGWAVLWFVLLGVEGLVFGVLIPWGLGALLSTVQNYFLHYPLPGSYRSYETPDRSFNSPLMHLLSFGACGLHNTHHAKPRAWNTAEKWWEFDTAALFIRLVRKKDKTS